VAAALFDLDRTLVRKETASLYVRYMRKRGGATWGDTARVTWWVAQYTLGVIDAQSVARRAALGLGGPRSRSCSDAATTGSSATSSRW
jgi:hypothetical protein